MIDIGQYWNPRQALLKQLLSKGDLENARPVLGELHSAVHSSSVYGTVDATIIEHLWDGLNERAFRTMPTVKDVTIAWNIWHITRIEDITSNILIADTNQVMNDEWMNRMHTSVKDTGNAMTDDEIIAFSSSLKPDELRKYRDTVGTKTKKILAGIRKEDLKHKFRKEQLERIMNEGCLLEHPDSIWLLDFWGKKNVAGILLMPITRHQVVHINDSIKLKRKCKC